jgi:hypothetical protein
MDRGLVRMLNEKGNHMPEPELKLFSLSFFEVEKVHSEAEDSQPFPFFG